MVVLKIFWLFWIIFNMGRGAKSEDSFREPIAEETGIANPKLFHNKHLVPEPVHINENSKKLVGNDYLLPSNNFAKVLWNKNTSNTDFHKDYALFAKNLQNVKLKGSTDELHVQDSDGYNEKVQEEQNPDSRDVALLGTLNLEPEVPDVHEGLIKVNENTGGDVINRNDQDYNYWPMDEGSGDNNFQYDSSNSDDYEGQNLNTTVEDIFNSTDVNLKYPESNSDLSRREDGIIERWIKEKQESSNSTESKSDTNSKFTFNNQEIKNKIKLFFGKSYDIHKLEDVLFPNGFQWNDKNANYQQILNRTFPLKLTSGVVSKFFSSKALLDLISNLVLGSASKTAIRQNSEENLLRPSPTITGPQFSKQIEEGAKNHENQEEDTKSVSTILDVNVENRNSTKTELFVTNETSRSNGNSQPDEILFSIKVSNGTNQQPDEKNIDYNIGATFIPINVYVEDQIANNSKSTEFPLKTKQVKNNMKMKIDENNQTETESSKFYEFEDLNDENLSITLQDEKKLENENIQVFDNSKVMNPVEESPLGYEGEDLNNKQFSTTPEESNTTIFEASENNEYASSSQDTTINNKDNLANNESVHAGILDVETDRESISANTFESSNYTLSHERVNLQNEELNEKSISNNENSNYEESITISILQRQETTETIDQVDNRNTKQNRKDLTKISKLSLLEENQNRNEMVSKVNEIAQQDIVNDEERPTTILPQGDKKFSDQSNTPLMKHTREDTSVRPHFCGYFCINETLCISLNASIALFVNNAEINLSEDATITTSWKPEYENANVLIEWYNIDNNSYNLSILIHMPCGNRCCFVDAVRVKIRNNETTGMLLDSNFKGEVMAERSNLKLFEMNIGSIYKSTSKTTLEFDHGIKLCLSDVIISTYENESGVANFSGKSSHSKEYYIKLCVGAAVGILLVGSATIFIYRVWKKTQVFKLNVE